MLWYLPNFIGTISLVRCLCFRNPGHLTQAEDRAHRIGVKKPVNVYYLLGKDSIDDIIWPLVNHKLKVTQKGTRADC